MCNCGVVADGANVSLAADDLIRSPDIDGAAGGDWYNISAVGAAEPLSSGAKIKRENSGPLIRRSASGNAVTDMSGGSQSSASFKSAGRNKSANNLSASDEQTGVERRSAVEK